MDQILNDFSLQFPIRNFQRLPNNKSFHVLDLVVPIDAKQCFRYKCVMLRQHFFLTFYCFLHSVQKLWMGALISLLFKHDNLCIWTLQSASTLHTCFPSFFSPSGSFILNLDTRIPWWNYALVRTTSWRLLLPSKKHHFLCITSFSQSSVILCPVSYFCFHTLIFTKEKIRKISSNLEHKNMWDMKTTNKLFANHR